MGRFASEMNPVALGCELTSNDAFTDNFTLELSDRHQDIDLKLSGRIGGTGVDALRWDDK